MHNLTKQEPNTEPLEAMGETLNYALTTTEPPLNLIYAQGNPITLHTFANSIIQHSDCPNLYGVLTRLRT